MGIFTTLKDLINPPDEDPLDEEDNYEVANDVVPTEDTAEVVEVEKEGDN